MPGNIKKESKKRSDKFMVYSVGRKN